MSWQSEMQWAFSVNLSQLPALAGGVVPLNEGPRVAADAAARLWRLEIPYRFMGDAHSISDFRRCRSRGFGACADAVAWVCAAGRLAGARELAACYELSTLDPDYAHVSALVDGFRIDPLPEYAYLARSCSGTVVFR